MIYKLIISLRMSISSIFFLLLLEKSQFHPFLFFFFINTWNCYYWKERYNSEISLNRKKKSHFPVIHLVNNRKWVYNGKKRENAFLLRKNIFISQKKKIFLIYTKCLQRWAIEAQKKKKNKISYTTYTAVMLTRDVFIGVEVMFILLPPSP